MAIFGIPAGCTAFLTQWWAAIARGAGAAATAALGFFVNPSPELFNPTTWVIKAPVDPMTVGTSGFRLEWDPYFRIPGPAIMKARALTVSANGTFIDAGFDGYLDHR
jgi:hypothetical protein